MTASVNLVWMTKEDLTLTQRSSTRWGLEHWNTVGRLYQDYLYRDPDFVTSSYDNYVLYFQRDSTNVVALTGGFAPNVYPSSSAQMAAACGGFGVWQNAWFLDETAGSVTLYPTIGSSNLAHAGLSNYVLGDPGVLIPGSDTSIRFTAADTTQFVDSTGSLGSARVSDDLLFMYVGRWRALPSYYGNIFGKVDASFNNGWAFYGTDGSAYGFSAGQGGGFQSSVTEYMVGEWHVGLGVVDRSSGLLQFAIRGLDTGRAIFGATSAVGNTLLTSSNPFALGNTGWVPGNDNFNLAAFYISSGSAVATGILPNIGQVLENFANYLGSYTLAQPTASFTVESWIKPFTGTLNHDLTIQSRNNVFWFGMTGSTGRLAFSSSFGIFTASSGPTVNQWNHVAVVYSSGTQTGTFYLNLSQVGTFSMQPLTATIHTTLHTVGNTLVNQGTGTEGVGTSGARSSFHGFIGESRFWQTARSWSDLSSSYWHRLTGSALTSSQVTLWFNEGPLSRVYNYPMGSGTVDRAREARASAYQTARLKGFDDRPGPSWHPSDNTLFTVPKQLAPSYVTANSSVEPATLARGDDVTRMIVINVPQAFFGRQIVPGTVNLVDNAYSSDSYGLVRTLVDDGRGNLYVYSGSFSGSVGWNKVGNVFYEQGLIAIKDPSLLDMWGLDPTMPQTTLPNDIFQLNFRGQSRVPVKTLMCRIERGDFNASTNQTFWRDDGPGHHVRRHPSGNLYVTTVGIYNSQRELVGVARLADPVRLRARDRLNIKLRMDF